MAAKKKPAAATKKPTKKKPAAAKKPAVAKKPAAAKKAPAGKVASDLAAVEAALAALSPKARAGALRLREALRALVPDTTEGIRYGICAFIRNGSLVGYAGFEDHCAFYAMSGTAIDKVPAAAPFAQGKGTLHFANDRPLPIAVLRDLVKLRVADDDARKGK